MCNGFQVALHFTGPLLRLAKTRGPCVRLERRCQGLLKGLGEAPARLEAFLSSLEKPKADFEAIFQSISINFNGIQSISMDLMCLS